MKHIFFSLIIVWLVFVLPARSETSPDSLELQLDTLQGKARVEVLSELCWQFGPIDIEKAEKYGIEKCSFLDALVYVSLPQKFLDSVYP